MELNPPYYRLLGLFFSFSAETSTFGTEPAVLSTARLAFFLFPLKPRRLELSPPCRPLAAGALKEVQGLRLLGAGEVPAQSGHLGRPRLGQVLLDPRVRKRRENWTGLGLEFRFRLGFRVDSSHRCGGEKQKQEKKTKNDRCGPLWVGPWNYHGPERVLQERAIPG